MYEEALLVPDDWPQAPCAYIALSPHYPHSVRFAEAAGWPMHRQDQHEDSHHFLPVAAPQIMSDVIAEVLGRLVSAA